MKCYRFKHIPTGMYWCPSRTLRKKIKPKEGETVWLMVKTNLSKKGKIYADLPSWRWLKYGIYNHLIPMNMIESGGPFRHYYTTNHHIPFVQSEWELEVL